MNSSQYTWVKVVDRPDPARAARAALSRVANASAVTARALAAGAVRRLSHHLPARPAPGASAGSAPTAAPTAAQAAERRRLPGAAPVAPAVAQPGTAATPSAAPAVQPPTVAAAQPITETAEGPAATRAVRAQRAAAQPPTAALAPPATGSVLPLTPPHMAPPVPAGARALLRRPVNGATAANAAARPVAGDTGADEGQPLVPRPGSSVTVARDDLPTGRPLLVWSPLRLPGTVSLIVPVPASALAAPPSTARAVPAARSAAVGEPPYGAYGAAGDATAASPGPGAPRTLATAPRTAGDAPAPVRGRHAAPGRPRTLGLTRPMAAGWRAVRSLLPTRRRADAGPTAPTDAPVPADGSTSLVPVVPATVAVRDTRAAAPDSAAPSNPTVPHPPATGTVRPDGAVTGRTPRGDGAGTSDGAKHGAASRVATRHAGAERNDATARVTDASARAMRANARRRLGRPAPRGRSWRPPAWGLVVAGLATGLVAGLGYGLLAPVEYEARGHVVVRASEGTDPAAVVGFAQVYGRIAAEPAVLAQAGDLPGTVRAASSPDAPVVEITGTAGSPAAAAAVANAVAPALVAYGNEAEAMTGTRLAVLAEARPPSAPSSPPVAAAAGVGAASGTLLASLALLVRHHRREHRTAPGPAASAPAGVETVLSRPVDATLPAPAPAPVGELTR
ncbi:hypothetical protein [Streptomyces bohaiensis]|uniref:hypothetical protein n=1 Tax=Streptomyces bohaiensis TaxID=1431344 RepID=UPI003B7C9C73